MSGIAPAGASTLRSARRLVWWLMVPLLALELLAEARFDAIVSDVRMPDLDGAALWRAVR